MNIIYSTFFIVFFLLINCYCSLFCLPKPIENNNNRKIICNNKIKIKTVSQTTQDTTHIEKSKIKLWQFEYDKYGNIIEYNVYHNNNIYMKYRYDYDRNNNMTNEIAYNVEGSIFYRINYFYDSLNHLSYSLAFLSDEFSYNNKTEYFYNNYGFLIAEKSINNNIINNVLYKYDTLNQLTEIIDSCNKYSITYEYINSKINVCIENSFNKEIYNKYIYYYKSNDIVSIMQYNSCGILIKKYTFAYKNDIIIQKSEFYENSIINQDYEYTFFK